MVWTLKLPIYLWKIFNNFKNKNKAIVSSAYKDTRTTFHIFTFQSGNVALSFELSLYNTAKPENTFKLSVPLTNHLKQKLYDHLDK